MFFVSVFPCLFSFLVFLFFLPFCYVFLIGGQLHFGLLFLAFPSSFPLLFLPFLFSYFSCFLFLGSHFSSSPLFFSFPFSFSLRYVVDAADHDKFETTKKELHDLLSKPPLSRIPLLVVGNKNDLLEAVTQEQLIEILFVFLFLVFLYLFLAITKYFISDYFFLPPPPHFLRDLNSIEGREVCCYSISAKNKDNIDKTLEWLIAHSSSPSQ